MNMIEIGLSFLEGLALIASPCILPVLPLMLSASAEGGRKRPFGIILGFVIAFTLFALLSRELVMALHINLDYIKYGSLTLLALFGCILLSEPLSNGFSALTQRFASAGSTLTVNAKEGFGSGILIGMLIGLVWTPCAGPILAAVLVQVIREENNLKAILMLAAFAFGAGIPMLFISLAGRTILAKFGFFTLHAEAVRKSFGVIILASVAFIASGIDIQPLFTTRDTPLSNTQTTLIHALPTPYPAPEFVGIEAWLNSKPLTMKGLQGKVVLVDFWTYSCINCVRTLPTLIEWDKKYRDKGLVIIGVHSPEFEFEKKKANVLAAIVAHGINYPVALDNKLDTFTHFDNRFWPAHYLINKQGQVVYTHFGEGDYNITENNIRVLLGLAAIDTTRRETAIVSYNETPETYLGSARADRFSSPGAVIRNGTHTYNFPKSLATDHWALSGKWRIENERIIAEEAGASLQLHFTAAKAFLVLGAQGEHLVQATVTLDGQVPPDVAGTDVKAGVIAINRHTLYELVHQNDAKEGLLKITAQAPGLEAYAFTFGN